MATRRALPLAAALLGVLAASCGSDTPPDNHGIEIYVSGVAPIVLDWSPAADQRRVSGWVHVFVDEQDPAPGAVTLTLNGVALPLEDPAIGHRFDAGAAGLPPLPPGSRISLEARTADGRAARFDFSCPGAVGVHVSPDPIVIGAPLTVRWDGPIYLSDWPLSSAPDPTFELCADQAPGSGLPRICSDYQTLAPAARSTTVTPLAYFYAGALGLLVQLDVVSDVQQQRFQDLQFHQGICVLRQRTAFAVAAP